MKRSFIDILTEMATMIFIGLFIAFLITRAVAPVKVVGSSMDPTYSDGQQLMVNRIAYKMDEPSYGDIVMFKPIDDIGDRYVKRIVGLPGDVVEVKDNKFYRNGVPIKEDYIKEPMTSENFKEYLLNEDEYFVLGDNRNNSRDSRYFGPINEEYIVGKIIGGDLHD